MSDSNKTEFLLSKLLDQSSLSNEDCNELKALLSTSHGRQSWVKELSFQADLIDILKTEKEISSMIQTDDTKIIPVRTSRQPVMSPSLRYAGWIALAAILMMAVFMSYYVNGIPGRANHTVLGKVVSLKGEVHLNRGPLNVEMISGMNFKEGDRLLTSKNGYIVFQYEDGSTITLSPNSRMVFATQKQKKQEGWSIGLDKGQLDAKIMPQQSKMRFMLPRLGIEVLGTQFSLGNQSNDHKVLLYEGKLSVVPIDHENRAHLLTSGQGIFFNEGSSQVNMTLIPQSQQIRGKIIEIDHTNRFLKVVLTEVTQKQMTLRFPQNQENFILSENSALTRNTFFKVGQTYEFQIQGLACPKIIHFQQIN